MPSGNHAEGTQDSSFSKTQVTVYRCEGCESDVCDSPDYEVFEKIGETQDKKFSNEIIQLVTNDTLIVMCFLQENTSLEGIYAIFWVKAIGIGESCGSLNSGGMFCWGAWLPTYRKHIFGYETELLDTWADSGVNE